MNKDLEKFYKWIMENSVFLLIDIEANSLWDWTFIDKETIQIWYCVFTSQISLLDKWSIFIKPKKNHILSEFIKELTWITQETIDNWVTYKRWLDQMMEIFWEYNCDYIVSYWNYDMRQLFSDCNANDVQYPFLEWDWWKTKKHINIKDAFASKLKIKPKWMGNLMNSLWLELKWKHHNWEHDCLNIVRMITHIFDNNT